MGRYELSLTFEPTSFDEISGKGSSLVGAGLIVIGLIFLRSNLVFVLTAESFIYMENQFPQKAAVSQNL